MTHNAHILIAEDEARLASILDQHLRGRGHRVRVVADGESALRAMEQQAFDVALLDIAMPPPNGIEVLRLLAPDQDPPEVVVTTGASSVDAAVQAMRFGAFAYLAKPYRMDELDVVVTRALDARQRKHELRVLRDQVERAEGADAFLTQYAPLQAVLALAVEVAASDRPLLITGEPGAGKCALAHLVHTRSARSSGPFVHMTGAALGQADAERALFGAAQPARRAAVAAGGTLYLADVHALGSRAHSRMASALTTGRYRPDGATTERAVRARVIAGATAPVPSPRTRGGRALVEVLATGTIALPPLRDRAVDIPLLASAFARNSGDAAGIRIEPGALEVLQGYSWPGNVAELRAVMARARLLCRGGVIRAEDLPIDRASGSLLLTDAERRHIATVLKTCNWHQGRAAAALDISPKTLYRKIREYGLQRPRLGVAE